MNDISKKNKENKTSINWKLTCPKREAEESTRHNWVKCYEVSNVIVAEKVNVEYVQTTEIQFRLPSISILAVLFLIACM